MECHFLWRSTLLLTLSGLLQKTLPTEKTENRYFCFGDVDGGMLTVRFTYRGNVIRSIGAGYWRKGKAIYEREN